MEHLHVRNISWSIIELAAKYGHLCQMPCEALTMEHLGVLNRRNKAPLHYAAESGYLHQIPQEVLNNIDFEKTKELCLLAAQKGEIYLLPSNKLTNDIVLHRHTDGRNALHAAAISKSLDQFHPSLLTAESLAIEDYQGWTVLLLAAAHGSLNQVPTKAIDEEELLRSYSGQTALDCAILNNHLDQLLGIDLSDKCSQITGQAWFQKNREFILSKQSAIAALGSIEDNSELEMF